MYFSVAGEAVVPLRTKLAATLVAAPIGLATPPLVRFPTRSVPPVIVVMPV